MTTLALTLVLISALLHADWNYLAKRAGGGMAFTWIFSVLCTILLSPRCDLHSPALRKWP